MRVVVRETDGAAVVPDTAIGPVRAMLHGDVRPTAGAVLDVELTIHHVAAAIDVTSDDVPSSHLEDDTTVLVAPVEAVDADGMGYLRLAADGLALLETDGRVTPGAWVRLRLPHPGVEAYVIGS